MGANHTGGLADPLRADDCAPAGIARAVVGPMNLDFEAGRWIPPIGDVPSANFEFLDGHLELRALGRLAEFNFSIDPNTALLKMRQFGEQLTRIVAPQYGVTPELDEDQFGLLKRLERSSAAPERAALENLHVLRKLGNAANHRAENRREKALEALEAGHRAGYWFVSSMSLDAPRELVFRKPQDPRKMWTEQVLKALAVRSNQPDTANISPPVPGTAVVDHEPPADDEPRLARSDAEALPEEGRTLSERSAESAEDAENAGARERLANQRVAELENQLSLFRKLTSIAQGIRTAGMDQVDGPGLPDWAAAVAMGEDPPAEIGELAEEVLEDLRALARDVKLPELKSPQVSLKSRGILPASQSGRFEIRVSLEDGSGPQTVRRDAESGVWQDERGRTFVLPGELRCALDTLAQGPPSGEDAATLPELTEQRQLWWGRLRRRLAPFGVSLDAYLRNSDAIVVDKLKAHIKDRGDGTVELLVSTPEVSPEELTGLVDRMRRTDRSPSIRCPQPDGSTLRLRLVFEPAARKAIESTRRIRSLEPRAAVQLVDAPETILDPELFDLSEYSDRVIGIGAPVYQVSRSMVRDDPDGAGRFDLKQVAGAVKD